MKKIFILIAAISFFSCGENQDSNKILINNYETRIIADSLNYPAVNLNENNLTDILILLHNEVALDQIKKYLNLSDKDFQSRLAILQQQELIRKADNGLLLPTCMVINVKEGYDLTRLARLLGTQVAEIIINKLPQIEEEYSKINAFKNISFDNSSLFILSDVLLNKYQMQNVESKFLKLERTKRNGKNYYYSIMEIDSSITTNAFGIYYDQMINFNNSLYEYYSNKAGQNNLSENVINNKNIPVLTKEDSEKLYSIASIITDDLIAYLEDHRILLRKSLMNSVFKDELLFREYFIWFYYFLAAETTNVLAEKGYIKMPESNSVGYFITK